MDDINHIGPDAEAARWHARMLATDCAHADRESLKEWLAHSHHHDAAYGRVARILSAVDSGRADPRLQLLAEQAFEESAAIPKKRAVALWTAAVAASLALVAITLVTWVGPHSDVSALAYETSEQRSTIVLSDGSTVVLDVGTRIAVKITDESREVKLLVGRALFEVAHDAGRPFSVEANDARTTALGTRFQVALSDKAVEVVLEEGSVAVERFDAGAKLAWSERLRPGEQVVIDSITGIGSKRAVDSYSATSWIQNRHVFRDTRLDDALQEINRYAAKKVRLGDPSLADWHLAGSFIAGDSEQIMAAVASVLPVRVVIIGEHEIVLFRRYSDLQQTRP
jgi:transmembrane sensor